MMFFGRLGLRWVKGARSRVGTFEFRGFEGQVLRVECAAVSDSRTLGLCKILASGFNQTVQEFVAIVGVQGLCSAAADGSL